MRLTDAIVCLPLLLALSAAPAMACSCVGTLGFASVIRQAAVVAVGQVVSVGETKLGNGELDPVSVEIVVLQTLKGRLSSRSIRVWNEMAGSSCGGMLSPLAVGVQSVVAVTPVAGVSSSRRELWGLLGFRPPEADYVITQSTCGETFKLLRSEREFRQWSHRRLR